MENEVMQIIVYAGNARSLAMQSIKNGKQGDILTAQKKMAEAESHLKEAHHTHAKILSISSDMNKKMELSLFMVHGEDHLMAAVTTIDLAKEFLGVHEELAQLKKEVKNMQKGAEK